MNNKVGILSLNINTHDLNYGAILHSYAFTKFLEKYDVNAEVIDYTTPMLENVNLRFPIKYYLKRKFIISAGLSMLRIFSHARRYDKFKRFQKEYMKVSKKHYNFNKLENTDLPYAVLVCESDVIWSADFFGGNFDKAFFLALDNMKDIERVAYAPSMSNCELNEKEEREFKKLIGGFSAISSRESYATKYIQKFTQKSVTWVLDPVLLLDKDDYKNIIEKRIVSEPYVLLYIPVKYDNNRMITEVEHFAKRKGFKVVEVSRYPWEHIRHKTITDAGVEEFLSLLVNAEIVFSNSFHAVCFSIIFEKEFYAFSRRTGKKIEDVCKRFHLDNRYIKDTKIIEQDAIDYNSVNSLLKKEKEISIKFIEENIISCYFSK